QLLFHYFRQLFAQVTNPPIDPIRERLVMSLRTTLGANGDLSRETPAHCERLVLPGPVLQDAQLGALRHTDDAALRTDTVQAAFDPRLGEMGLARALDALCRSATSVVRGGARILIVSDRDLPAHLAPIPSLLAVSAVHKHLIREGVRQQCGLVVESGEPREVMHVALLLGFGA